MKLSLRKAGRWLYEVLFKEHGWDSTDVGWLLTISMECLIIWMGLRADEVEGQSILKFDQFLSLKPSEMGDTFAGIFSALALIWIIVTVFLQSRELKEQKDEFRKMNESMVTQRLEQTFFEMLDTHRQLVGAMSVHTGPGKTVEGREAISYMQRKLFAFLKNKRENSDVLDGYREFWKTYRKHLSHYFRFLFNFFRLLDEKNESDAFYVKVLRSQLSNEELSLLYYNCISDDGKKFEEYAQKFEIFDNIDVKDFAAETHKSLLRRRVFGEKTARKLGL